MKCMVAAEPAQLLDMLATETSLHDTIAGKLDILVRVPRKTVWASARMLRWSARIRVEC
jgi:hypothetical protein